MLVNALASSLEVALKRKRYPDPYDYPPYRDPSDLSPIEKKMIDWFEEWLRDGMAKHVAEGNPWHTFDALAWREIVSALMFRLLTVRTRMTPYGGE